jgi:hypothetical protein
MVGVRREMTDGVPADIGRLRVIKGRELMRDIQDAKIRIDLCQLAFDSPYQIIPVTDIRCQGD